MLLFWSPSTIAQRQSNRLLTGRFLVRIQVVEFNETPRMYEAFFLVERQTRSYETAFNSLCGSG